MSERHALRPTPRDITKPDVWAPNASRVELILDDGDAQTMRPAEKPGWWTIDQQLMPGQHYWFRLDGGAPIPDPRSLYQPLGVHGPSEIVDPALFANREFPSGQRQRGKVIYELHVGTFTPEGTLDSAIDKLDYLVDLGVAAVELMPLASAPGVRGWGYDGVGMYAVHEVYGGPAALVRFVDAAHARDLRVVLDVVHNHWGPEGNYLAEFGPYFTDRYITPWGPAVNLDAEGASEVRQFLAGSVQQWFELYGVDGLRLDAVHELRDESDQHFLADLALLVQELERQQGRPLALIAEAHLNQPSMVARLGSEFAARGMNAQWADDVHHAIHSFMTGEESGYYVDFNSMTALAKALTRVFVHDGIYSTFRKADFGAPVNPDTESYDGHSFVVFIQNHDQVGNRPWGDRISDLASPGVQAAGAALYLLSAFTPMLFMGEEFAASTPFLYFSHLGPELGPLVTEGRAAEFSDTGWAEDAPDPQHITTMRRSILHWEEPLQPEHARMLEWYRTLIALRHHEPEIMRPDLRSVEVEIVDDDSLLMHRGSLSVIVTRNESGVSVEMPNAEIVASWDQTEIDASGTLRLPSAGATVVRRQ